MHHLCRLLLRRQQANRPDPQARLPPQRRWRWHQLGVRGRDSRRPVLGHLRRLDNYYYYHRRNVYDNDVIVCITMLLIMSPFLLGFSVFVSLVFFLFSPVQLRSCCCFLPRFVLLSSFTQKPLPSRLSHTHTHTYTRARLDTSRSNVHRRDDWVDEPR